MGVRLTGQVLGKAPMGAFPDVGNIPGGGLLGQKMTSSRGVLGTLQGVGLT